MRAFEKMEKQKTRQKSDEPSNEAAAGRFLIFRMGRYSLALSLDSIRRVHDAEGVPPRTPGSRVLDLYPVLGETPASSVGYWIEMEVDERKFLMPVEIVEEIRELSLAVPMPYPGVLRGPETSCLKRLFFDGLRMMVEIDPAELARQSERSLGGGLGAAMGSADEDRTSPGAKTAAAPTDRKEDGGLKRIVVFEVSGVVRGMDLDRVARIVSRDEVHAVPAAGRKIMGAVYYNDLAVPLASELPRGGSSGEPVPVSEDFTMMILAEADAGLIGVGCDRIVRVLDGISPGSAQKEYEIIEPERIVANLD